MFPFQSHKIALNNRDQNKDQKDELDETVDEFTKAVEEEQQLEAENELAQKRDKINVRLFR